MYTPHVRPQTLAPVRFAADDTQDGDQVRSAPVFQLGSTWTSVEAAELFRDGLGERMNSQGGFQQ